MNDDLPLEEAYFLWLCSQVGLVDKRRNNKAKTYWTLLRLLHGKEFTWHNIDLDANRADDGKNLRLRFLDETGRHSEGDFGQFGCSMLELLVALSFDLAWNSDDQMDKWFWVLIKNLGLFGCSDAYPPSELMFDNIINKFINRDYDADGHGGLFPLQEPTQDQRRVELHYQAQAYLMEQAPI
jgi:hypothetical protein